MALSIFRGLILITHKILPRQGRLCVLPHHVLALFMEEPLLYNLSHFKLST